MLHHEEVRRVKLKKIRRHTYDDEPQLLFRKDKELCLSLYRILGFYPHNIELYRIALAHKSSHYVSNEKGRPLNNERLEFLGDAILEAVTSDIIFHRYERKREGFLTTTRSKLVQRDTLNRLARETGLDSLVKKNTTGRTHNNYLGGNAFEALVGAVYLDRGYRHCHWFVSHRIIGKLVDLDDMARKEVNFKSKLLEWSQKNRIQLEFKLDESIDTTGNSPEFRSYAILEGITAGEGKGFSKKESHQQAAKEALMKLRREPQFIDRILRSKEKRTAIVGRKRAFSRNPDLVFVEIPLIPPVNCIIGTQIDRIEGKGASFFSPRSEAFAPQTENRSGNAPEYDVDIRTGSRHGTDGRIGIQFNDRFFPGDKTDRIRCAGNRSCRRTVDEPVCRIVPCPFRHLRIPCVHRGGNTGRKGNRQQAR